MRIVDSVTTIKDPAGAIAQREVLRDQTFPFERDNIDNMFGELKVSKAYPKLDAAFKRFDLLSILAMRKRQMGIPFPVPRFAMIDIHNQTHASYSFTLNEWNDTIRALDESCSIPRGISPGPNIGPAAAKAINWLTIVRPVSVVLGLILTITSAILITSFGWMFAFGAVVPVGLFINAIITGATISRYMDKMVILHAKPYGFIPQKTRQLVIESNDKFDYMFLVFEPKWSLDYKDVPRRNYDPLLIGVKVENNEWLGAWIIDDFDLTDQEQFAKDKFAYKP